MYNYQVQLFAKDNNSTRIFTAEGFDDAMVIGNIINQTLDTIGWKLTKSYKADDRYLASFEEGHLMIKHI